MAKSRRQQFNELFIYQPFARSFAHTNASCSARTTSSSCARWNEQCEVICTLINWKFLSRKKSEQKCLFFVPHSLRSVWTHLNSIVWVFQLQHQVIRWDVSCCVYITQVRTFIFFTLDTNKICSNAHLLSSVILIAEPILHLFRMVLTKGCKLITLKAVPFFPLKIHHKLMSHQCVLIFKMVRFGIHSAS